MRRLSRRKFFGLVGCAAAAAALPTALVGELEPAVVPIAWAPMELYNFRDLVAGDFTILCPSCRQLVSPSRGHHCGYVHGMPYWVAGTMTTGLTLGIERTAKP